MLNRLGFCEKWRQWMMSCIFSGNVSILVNGSLTEEFQTSKGLRQGDSLAPFLLLIAAEGLAGLMRSAIDLGNFQPFNAFDSVPISLLQFVDDTIIVGDSSWENL